MPTPDSRTALTLALSHGKTRVRLEGPRSGPKVLLVHGMTYPLEVWDPLAKDLIQEGCSVARFDLYGRGEASWTGEPLSPRVLATQAFEVLDAIEWTEPVHWVSLSNSDLVLVNAARHGPHHCKSLSLIAPSGFDRRLMNPRIRLASRLPGCAGWMGGRLQRTCIERMKGHRSHLSPEMQTRVGHVYDQSMHWAATNPHFPRAVFSQIQNLPTDAEVLDDLDTISTSDLSVHALRFGEEGDSTDEGLTPFLGAMPCARVEMLQVGTHMGLLEHSHSVNAWVLRTLC